MNRNPSYAATAESNLTRNETTLNHNPSYVATMNHNPSYAATMNHNPSYAATMNRNPSYEGTCIVNSNPCYNVCNSTADEPYEVIYY